MGEDLEGILARHGYQGKPAALRNPDGQGRRSGNRSNDRGAHAGRLLHHFD
jgi:hypothetical protein